MDVATTRRPLVDLEAVPRPDDAAAKYLDLLNDSLTGVLEGPALAAPKAGGRKKQVIALADRALARWNLRIARTERFDLEERLNGASQPLKALTQIGRRRLLQLEAMLRVILDEEIPGDALEAGAWRGGAAIFMRGALDVLGGKDRRVWLADSFAGYPEPGPTASAADRELYEQSRYWQVTRAEVEGNLRRYHADAGVEIIEGWFDQSLPQADLSALALVRVDVDGYEGVKAALEVAWPKLSPGGFVLVEDVEVPGARRAALEMRDAAGIERPWSQLPGTTKSVYWRK